MAVVFAAEPAGARAVAAALRRFHRTGLTGVRLVGPVPVFDLTVADVRAGRLPASVVPSALRFLVANRDGAIVQAVDVVPTATGYRFAALTTAFADGTDRALAGVETTGELADPAVRFELAAVRVRALEMFALWFRSPAREQAPDMFVVVAPAPDRIATGVLMRAEQFRGSLADAVAHWAARAALVRSR